MLRIWRFAGVKISEILEYFWEMCNDVIVLEEKISKVRRAAKEV